MKKTKLSRFFESLIYFILLTIPLISVFARVIYVQSNQEAYRSYSGVDAEVVRIENVTDFQLNTEYRFITGSYTPSTTSNFAFVFEVLNINSTTNSNFYNLFTIGDYYRCYLYSNGTYFLFNTSIGGYVTEFSSTSINYIDMNIIVVDFLSTPTYDSLESVLYEVSYFDNYYLDNAFDYGIQKTIDDFGVGNINFLNWFGTMFSNNTNLLYINFVNMYLNYALWVSVGYLLYYFLNWFIRFVREILDNLIYKETKN